MIEWHQSIKFVLTIKKFDLYVVFEFKQKSSFREIVYMNKCIAI